MPDFRKAARIGSQKPASARERSVAGPSRLDHEERFVMTRFPLAVHHDGTGPNAPPEELQQSIADTEAFDTRAKDSGAFVFRAHLHGVESATVACKSSDDHQVTDGPYSAAKETLSCLWIISAADADAALEWARQATAACRMAVEFRALA